MRNKRKYFLKLRGAVAQNGLTLKKLSEELGISQQSLNEKLHGRSQFTLAEMIKTCNLLNSKIDIFFDPQLHDMQFAKTSNAN